MTTWTFFGRTIPERIPLTLGQELNGSAQDAFIGDYTFCFAIHHAQAVVTITVAASNAQDIYTLRNTAADILRGVTDLAGYRHGIAFDVEIISAIEHGTSKWTTFGIEIPVLASSRTDVDKVVRTDTLIAIGTNPSARIALADFRRAMLDPSGTGFYCFRAIEAMMQSMKLDPAARDATAWAGLREALSVDRSAIDWVKTHADLPRHGRPSDISDADRAKVFTLTDEIIRRFLIYIERGKTRLSPAEFPNFSA